MKNYKEMSDFEINKAVFFLSGIYYEDVIVSQQKVTGNSIQYGDGANWYEFNPCNNPSDAWFIIQQYKISLYLDDGLSFAFNGENINQYGGDVESYDYEYSDSNILRAAMIVFLMMKEKEQETK